MKNKNNFINLQKIIIMQNKKKFINLISLAYPGHGYVYQPPTDFFQAPWYLLVLVCILQTYKFLLLCLE